MKKIRWAVCGLGNIAKTFLNAIKTIPNAEVTACVSSSLERAAAFKQQHGLAHACTYDTLKDIRHEIDAVYICTNMHMHYINALAFLPLSIPCLVEKSFALNYTEAKEMIDCAQKHDVLLMEAMWTVFLPASLKAAEIIKSGYLGKPLSAYGSFCEDMTALPNSRVFDKSLGGGSILDLMVYNVAYGQMLFGEPEKVDCDNVLKNGVDLSCEAKISYPSGVNAVFRSSIVDSGNDLFKVVCENGELSVPAFYGATEFTVTKNGIVEKYDFETRPGFYYQIDHFNKLLLSGAKQSPVRSFSDTILTMQTLTKLLD